MGKSNVTVYEPEEGPNRTSWSAWASSCMWLVLTVLVLAPLPHMANDSPGERPGADVVAPIDITVPDDEATARHKEEISEHHPRYWNYNPTVRVEAKNLLGACFDILASSNPESGKDLDKISQEIERTAHIRLQVRDLDYLYKNVSTLALRQNLDLVLDSVLDNRLIVADEALFTAHFKKYYNDMVFSDLPENLRRLQNQDPLDWPEEARQYLTEIELRPYYSTSQQRPVVEIGAEILLQVLKPNLVFDEAETRRSMNEKIKALEANPIPRLYEKGAIIAHKNGVLSPVEALAVSEFNELRRQAYPFQLLGILILTILCFAITIIYLSLTKREIRFTPSNLAMMFLPMVLALGMGRWLIHLELVPHEVQSVLFPSALVGVLATIVLGPQAGFILVLITTLLFGFAMQQGLGFLLVALFGGFTSVLSLHSIRERMDVVIAGLRVGAVNVASVVLLSLFRIPHGLNIAELLPALINGAIFSWAALPLIVIFERAFGVITDIRLLEITGPQHPLMRMLEDKAPGTFEHVNSVTKLAEAAADDIGANYLLVRAGAYFHDIGKMLKPKYFSENQVTLDDKKAHSRLTPYMSVLIIKNHVKEGIELGKKYNLPPKVIDFIPQHHGTSLIKYFYIEALHRFEETESTHPVREEEFRYPGPKPQSAEAGIVLLADTVEAIVTATFTQSKVNEHDLRRVVAQAVSDRFSDGQFDECDITLRDLFLIRESFVRTLKARFHHRIAYPTMARKEAPREAGVAAPTSSPG